MKTGGKVVVGLVTLMVVAGLVAFREGEEVVRLSGVTAGEVYLVTEPGAGGGFKTPKGIVVTVSKYRGDWAFVTVPASIADALFDKPEDVSGWVPRSALTDLVPRA